MKKIILFLVLFSQHLCTPTDQNESILSKNLGLMAADMKLLVQLTQVLQVKTDQMDKISKLLKLLSLNADEKEIKRMIKENKAALCTPPNAQIEILAGPTEPTITRNPVTLNDLFGPKKSKRNKIYWQEHDNKKFTPKKDLPHNPKQIKPQKRESKGLHK